MGYPKQQQSSSGYLGEITSTHSPQLVERQRHPTPESDVYTTEATVAPSSTQTESLGTLDDNVYRESLMLNSAFLCTVCKTVPRPRFNQAPFYCCSNKDQHIVCASCLALNNNNLYCKSCKGPIQQWNCPIADSFLLLDLYRKATQLCTFECLRQCGQSFSGFEDVINHDKTCKYGRKMFCPLDSLEIEIYNHEINNHTRHLVSNFPSRYTPRTWSITFNWEDVSDNLEYNQPIPAQLLYLESDSNYFAKRESDLANPYTPIAACVTFKVVEQTFKYGSHITTCELRVQWLEGQPVDTESSTLACFTVQEIKPECDSLNTNSFYLMPTYQVAPPPPSAPERRRRDRPKPLSTPSPRRLSSPAAYPFEGLYVQLFDNTHLNDHHNSKLYPCYKCGSLNKMHTHFEFVLEDPSK